MLDLNAGRPVKVREASGKEVTFTVKPLPFAVVIECQERETQARAALDRVSRVEPNADPKLPGRHVPVDDSPEARAAFTIALDGVVTARIRTSAEALRWGLRAYAVGERGEEATVDGRSFRVLSPDAVEAVAGWGGAAAVELAAAIQNQNVLSASDLLGFLQPSGS